MPANYSTAKAGWKMNCANAEEMPKNIGNCYFLATKKRYLKEKVMYTLYGLRLFGEGIG